MLSPTTAAPIKLSNVERRVLVLLVISVGINYIDRGTLSVAAPQLTREMALNPEKMGLLLSGFFWTYAVCQILGGWLVDRYNVRWVYGIGFVLWSGATFATGLISSFAALFALRLLLGLGESVAYPSYSKIIAGSFPQTHPRHRQQPGRHGIEDRPRAGNSHRRTGCRHLRMAQSVSCAGRRQLALADSVGHLGPSRSRG